MQLGTVAVHLGLCRTTRIPVAFAACAKRCHKLYTRLHKLPPMHAKRSRRSMKSASQPRPCPSRLTVCTVTCCSCSAAAAAPRGHSLGPIRGPVRSHHLAHLLADSLVGEDPIGRLRTRTWLTRHRQSARDYTSLLLANPTDQKQARSLQTRSARLLADVRPPDLITDNVLQDCFEQPRSQRSSVQTQAVDHRHYINLAASPCQCLCNDAMLCIHPQEPTLG